MHERTRHFPVLFRDSGEHNVPAKLVYFVRHVREEVGSLPPLEEVVYELRYLCARLVRDLRSTVLSAAVLAVLELEEQAALPGGSPTSAGRTIDELGARRRRP